jgi:predicted TIM-barrel fold metal-dependent hydrolase
MAMGDFEPISKISQLNLSENERRQIFGANAARAVKL